MNRQKQIDEKFMRLAIEQAQLAEEKGEIPIGAVVVFNGDVIAAAHNEREIRQDPTAHAELIAMQNAAAEIGSWRLIDCTTYVTLEPCPMCAGTMVNSRLSRAVYGAPDPKAGAVRTLYAICEDPRLNHRVEIKPGILAQECGDLLTNFFARVRQKNA